MEIFKLKIIYPFKPTNQVAYIFYACFHFLPYVYVLSSLFLGTHQFVFWERHLSASHLLGMVEDWGLENHKVR